MIISLTGPSGIGKGYITCELKKHMPSMRELVWLTTRPLRPTEESGITNRRSISREDLKLLQKSGNVVLIQELYGQLYGLELTTTNYDQELWICELHIDNLQKALKLGLPIFSIGLIPNEVAFIETRLRDYRRTEDDNEIAQRLVSAEKEIAKIVRHRTIFSAFLEISAENEGVIVNDVIKIIRQSEGGKATR